MQKNIKNYFHIFTLNILIMVVATLSSLYIISSNNLVIGYERMYLLPLVFGVCFSILLSKPLITSKSIFLWTFFIFSALRYIALPFLMINQGYFRGFAYYPPHPSSVQKGILLMLYEIIISSIIIRCMYKKYLFNPNIAKINDNTKHKFTVKNKFVYFTFIVFSIILLAADPNIIKGISFFTNFNRRVAGSGSILSSLSTQFIMLAKLLIYFIIIDRLYKSYIKSNKKRYLLLTYLISFINIGVFVGTNRKRVLMNAISSGLIINYLYPKQRRKTLIIISVLAIALFFQLTIFRFYSNNDRSIFDNTAGTLQVYLSGPYNMALAVETREEFKEDISIFNIIYDFGRPFYGVGQYFKKFNSYTSTEYFNKRLSIGGPLRSDQIMPITGQGLLHFGYILSPIYLILSIVLGLYTEKRLKNTYKLENKYILSLICMMFGQAMGVNFIIITNFVTFEGVLFYMVYYFNSKISTRKIGGVGITCTESIKS